MRWHLTVRSFPFRVLLVALTCALAACATTETQRGPLGGTVAPPLPQPAPAPVPEPEGPRVTEEPLPDLNRDENVYFAQGSSVIDAAGKETIRRHADRLRNNRRLVVTLIGYGSSDGGSTEYKIALGQKRLDAVAEELKGAGAALGQIRKQSSPPNKSRNPRCASEGCHQQERRVELRYINLKTPPSRRVP
jgi:outer membrane protein OmpA-like peptidoglycan-associated protein